MTPRFRLIFSSSFIFSSLFTARLAVMPFLRRDLGELRTSAVNCLFNATKCDMDEVGDASWQSLEPGKRGITSINSPRETKENMNARMLYYAHLRATSFAARFEFRFEE